MTMEKHTGVNDDLQLGGLRNEEATLMQAVARFMTAVDPTPEERASYQRTQDRLSAVRAEITSLDLKSRANWVQDSGEQ